MKLPTIIDALHLKVNTEGLDVTQDVTGVYVSDLLSDVLAHAQEGDIWITLQGHPNVVAVATMKDLCGIILVNSRVPETETLARAQDENMPIFTSEESSYRVAGQLFQIMEEG
ncbi:serine kinase [Candidatus Neomarinimicrobiota bacterium]